jgi:hypothetical protein
VGWGGGGKEKKRNSILHELLNFKNHQSWWSLGKITSLLLELFQNVIQILSKNSATLEV